MEGLVRGALEEGEGMKANHTGHPLKTLVSELPDTRRPEIELHPEEWLPQAMIMGIGRKSTSQ